VSLSVKIYTWVKTAMPKAVYMMAINNMARGLKRIVCINQIKNRWDIAGKTEGLTVKLNLISTLIFSLIHRQIGFFNQIGKMLLT
jgi:hypothetical protein